MKTLIALLALSALALPHDEYGYKVVDWTNEGAHSWALTSDYKLHGKIGTALSYDVRTMCNYKTEGTATELGICDLGESLYAAPQPDALAVLLLSSEPLLEEAQFAPFLGTVARLDPSWVFLLLGPAGSFVQSEAGTTFWRFTNVMEVPNEPSLIGFAFWDQAFVFLPDHGRWMSGTLGRTIIHF